MGLETLCRARVGRKQAEGKAMLETSELIFRSTELRVVIPLNTVLAVEPNGEELRVAHAEGELFLGLGAKKAAAWAQRILNPRGLIDKLEVNPDSRVALIGVSDKAFIAEVKARTSDLSLRKPKAETDRIFLEIASFEELEAALKPLVASLKQNGGIWILYPKSGSDDDYYAIKAAADTVGMVDHKYVGFSKSLGAMKLVIRKENRKGIAQAVKPTKPVRVAAAKPKRDASGAMVFEAVVNGIGPGGAWADIALPSWVSDALGKRGTVPVAGTINGFQFRTSASPDGKGGHTVMVNKAMRAGGNITPENVVARFTLAVDVAPRAVEVPSLLAAAMKASPIAKAAFARLAPSHQKEYVEFITEAKKEETRLARVAKTLALLEAAGESGKPKRLKG